MDETQPIPPVGNIGMADPDPIGAGLPTGDPGIPQPPAPEPPTLVPETFVVGPVGAPASAAENPFIPKGVVPENPAVGAVPASPPPPGNPLPRRILLVLIFLVFLAGLALAGKFALGYLAGAKEVTLQYWGLWENDATVQSAIADFQAKNPKIKVTYVKQSPRQYRERLQAAITRGDGPDVFRFHNTWVPMLRDALSPVPKTVMTAADFASTFYPVAANDLVAGTTIFGIPLMVDGLGLYYNEDLFAAAGVTPPTTWEEMLNIVPKLTVKKDTTITTSALALGTTNNVENFSDIVATMMLQNGADLRKPTGKEAEEALIFYHKFADPADPVYTWNDTLDNSIYAFAIGRVAMILAPSWRAFDIKEISKTANPTLRFKVVPIPQLPGNTVTWASYWVEGVSTKSKNQPQAWTFLQYLTSREVATKLYTEAGKTRLFGEPYARVDLGSTVTSDDYVGAYVKQAPTARSFPLASRTFDNGLNDKLIKYLEDAINAHAGGTAPTAALQTMAAGFTQVLGSFGLTSGAAAPTTQ